MPPLPICSGVPPPNGMVVVQQTDFNSCVPSQSPVCPLFVPPFWTLEKPVGSPAGSSVTAVNEMPFRPTVLRKFPSQVTFRQETTIVTSVLVTVAVNKVLLPSLPVTVNGNESALAVPAKPNAKIPTSIVMKITFLIGALPP